MKLQNYKMTFLMCQIHHISNSSHIKKKKKKKKNPGFGKNRVGRVSGNPTFFFLGLTLDLYVDKLKKK